ncbi:uncharacterized protein [Ambystoma mexicanum]|uniref:uncharacterized protein isoform X7 n=1 Tax=Ambystoma mexicanum TaxID=8296 RepID=UPI0037E75A73
MPGQGSHEMEAPFLDAPACFPEEEWKLLKEWQKDLYRNVMKEIHLALLALGPLIVNTVFSLRTKERRKPPSPADSPEAHRICGGGITDGEELFSLNVEDKLDSKSSQKTEEREIHCHSTEDEDTPSIFIDNFGEEVRERSLDTDSGYEIISFCTKEDDGPDFRDDWDRERQQTPSRPTGHEMISFCIKEDEAPDCSEDRDSERQSSPGRLAGHASMATIVTLRVKEEADADCMEPHESEIADCTGSPSERAGSTIETWCVKDEADTYSMECYESEIGEYTECTAERAGSTIETWCVKDEADTYSMECHESEIGEYTECTAERAGSTIETWCVKDEADTYSMECHESEIGEYTECAAGSSSGPVDIKDEDETHFMEVHNPGVVATGDAGYALTPWLMTPIRRPRNRHEEAYNRAHVRTRGMIERTFGLLKARFRCFSRSWGSLLYKPVKTGQIVVLCAMLHNLCMRRNVPLPPDTEDDDEVDDEDDDGDGMDALPGRGAQD